MKKIEKMKKTMFTAVIAALLLLSGFTLKAQEVNDVVLCNGQTVTLTANTENEGDAPTFEWYLNDDLQKESGPTFKFTPVDGDTVYCVVTSNANCAEPITATSILHAFTVNPLPVLTQPEDLVFCHNEEVSTLSFSGLHVDGGAVIWEIIEGDGKSMGLESNSGTGSIPTFTANNTNLDTATITIQVTPVSVEGCIGTPQTFTISVKPLLLVEFEFGTTLEYCQNELDVETLPTTALSGITGTWDITTISTTDAGIVVYTFTPDEGECISNDTPIELTVTVNPTLVPTVEISYEIE